MQLENRIREIRKAYNLTQAEIAYHINISPSAFGQIECKAGKSTFETLTRIADAIGVTLPFLVDITNSNYIEEKTSYNLLVEK